MIDAHCHLQASPTFQPERTQILADFDDNYRPKMLELSSEYPQTFCVIGTHPWRAGEESSSDWIDKLNRRFIEKHAIIGIGEIGLDYFRAQSSAEKILQKTLLEKQFEVAKDYQLPVVLHCVKAHQELLADLATFEWGGIIHGFRSSYEIGKRYLDSGFSISIGNAIHAKTGAKLRDAVQRLGVENIVIESDAHLLEHASLDKTVCTLAEIFKLDIESLEMELDRNLERVFPKVEK